GEYEIEREIGRGGMGIVYLARQKDLDRQVALKVIPPTTLSKITRQRFLREAKALASLSHPNIVPVFTAGEQAGSLFIAMEYVPGVPLSTLIRAVRNRPAGQKASQAWAQCLASGTAPEDDAAPDRAKETAALDSQYLHTCLAVAGQIADALARAHDGGIIHRDIKPANIIIAPDGRARLLDFGLAAVHTEPHVTVSGEFFGTPHYVSPEQAAGLSGLVGPASDQYSLGAMLYECLALRPPFDGDSISVVLANVLNGDPKGVRHVNPTLPKDIDTILAKTLSRFPQERYNSMSDFAEDLERFASGRPILAKRANWMQRLVKWSRRRPAVAVLLVLMVAMIITGAGIWTYQERQRRRVEHAADKTELQAKKDRADRDIQAATAEQWQYARLMAEADSQWRAGDAPETKRLLAQTATKWRNWEWDMLAWRCDAQKQSFPRGSAATFLAWRPDGKALAVSSNAGDVQVWDTTTGKLSWSLVPSYGYTGGVAWLDGGKRLVMACGDGNVRIWDSAGKHLKVFPGAPSGAVQRTGHAISGLAVSSDQRLVLTSGGYLNEHGWVRLHDLASGKLIKVFIGHKSVIDSVAFMPGEKRFATAGRDGVVHLWNIARDKPTASMRGHGAGYAFVYDVIFTPDGKHLVTAGQDGLAHLWNTQIAKRVRTFRSTGSDIRTLAISPDGKLLAGIAVDGTATLWDLLTGKIITLFRGHGLLPLSVAFSPDGKSLATGGQKSTRIWDLSTRQEGRLFGRLSALPKFTCDGAKIAAVGGHEEGLRIWSANGRTMIADVTKLGNKVANAACHPTKPNLLIVLMDNRSLILWDMAEDKSRWTVTPKEGDKTNRSGLAFSPDGRFIAIGAHPPWLPGRTKPGGVTLYDAASGELLKKLVFPGYSTIDSVAFSPDGRYVAAASPYINSGGKQIPGGIALWRVSDGQYVRTLHGQDSGLYSFAFSPDSKRIALGNNNNVIRILDVKSAKTVATLHGHKSRIVAMAFSPDGRRLVSVGHEVLLWDMLTSQPVMTLLKDNGGYNKTFHSVTFSPDGNSIAGGGYNRQIQLWSLPENRSKDRQPTSRPAAGTH
ncbi:MAG: protein kinase, partial [Phycisphaerae bacterium]|nr:protein kinase [Phycisphaerae bacterium]